MAPSRPHFSIDKRNLPRYNKKQKGRCYWRSAQFVNQNQLTAWVPSRRSTRFYGRQPQHNNRDDGIAFPKTYEGGGFSRPHFSCRETPSALRATPLKKGADWGVGVSRIPPKNTR